MKLSDCPDNAIVAYERCNNPGSSKDDQITRKEYLLLLALFVAALAVRLYFIPFYRVISADGIGYVFAARNLLKGVFSPLTVYGVVYPALTAAVSLSGLTTELSGRLVSAFMGSLLVIPLYLLAREFFNRNVGIIACILVIAWPPLRSWAGEVMTQATYITLIVTWYWLLWRAYRLGSTTWALAAGFFAGLSYLTRPESLVAFVFMAPVLLLHYSGNRTIKKRLMLFATCVGAFVVMLLPFVLLVHNVTGEWQLTGKGGFTLADAMSEYFGRPDLKNEPGFKGIGFLEVIRSYPDFMWMNFSKNLVLTLKTMLPWYLWAAAAVGFVVGRCERIKGRLYLVASFAPLGVIVVFFFVGPEYLQPYLPVLFLWAANALSEADQRLLKPLAAANKRLSKYIAAAPLAMAAVSCLTVFLFIRQVPADRNKPYHYGDDGGRYDHRRIGELLKKNLPSGAKIMTRSGRISFYAEMDNIGMPQASMTEMIAVARKNGARYIIVDGMLIGQRPQFSPLFTILLNGPDKAFYIPVVGDTPYTPVPGLRLNLLYKDPSSVGVAVYEVVN